MHVKAARRAVIGDIERRTDPVRHQDLQIGNRERRIAGDPHIRQTGKMRVPCSIARWCSGFVDPPAIAARPVGRGNSAPRSNTPSSVHTEAV